MSRCVCCDLRLESYDDLDYCRRCKRASEDENTLFIDPQHLLITETGEGCVLTPVRGGKD